MGEKIKSNIKVLFVDDDPYMHRLVKLYLSEENIVVEFAGNGRIALHKLESDVYDIIVSDLQMPEMDGISLINEIKTRRINVPIITISAFGMDNMALKAKEAGAFEVLQKPFDSANLIYTITKALKRRT